MKYLHIPAVAAGATADASFGVGTFDVTVYARAVSTSGPDRTLVVSRANGQGIQLQVDHNPRFAVARGDGTGFQRKTGPTTFDFGTWHTFRGTYDVATGAVVGYLDGGSELTSTFRTGTITPEHNLRVGAYVSGHSGGVADVAWMEMRESIGGALVAKFDAAQFDVGDGPGATAVDGQGNTWTLSGTGIVIGEEDVGNLLLLGVG